MLNRFLSPGVIAVATLGLLASLLAVAAAAAEPPGQILRAPFTCGTEWHGGTRAGHGYNDLNLDLNRTSRTYDDPQHDLGQPLLAQADGVVSWVGWHYRAGTYLDIDYGEITVRYVHLVDESIPDGVDEVGDTVVEGQLIGLLGDTGNATHAHLHLEYFDSRDYDDAAGWQIPDENQIQIAIDGNPIDPWEVFVSTNCDGEPLPPATTTTTTTTTAPPPHPFTDVPAASYAYLDVALLFDHAITTGTSDTAFSPGDVVDREQMAAFLARVWRLHDPDAAPPDEPFPFDDVADDSYARADIHLLHSLTVTAGTSETTYSPADAVTREQMAAFLGRVWRLMHPETVEPEGDYPFDDVADDSYARADIHLLHALELTTGTGPRSYSPGDPVTREQMAAFLARLLRSCELV